MELNENQKYVLCIEGYSDGCFYFTATNDFNFTETELTTDHKWLSH